ncbi:MAG TPA: hypothetical protein VHA09_01905 [Nitrososphaera sp.]|nr:hypothetical protein [Nitrososphaera sp.]
MTISKESQGVITTLIDNDIATTTAAHSASRKSAESIVGEGPAIVSSRGTNGSSSLLLLPDFGTATFTGCTTNNGRLGTLVANLYQLTLTSDWTIDGKVLAIAGPITENGNGFEVLNKLG